MLNRIGILVVIGSFFALGCSDSLVNESGLDEESLQKRELAAGQQSQSILDIVLETNEESGEFSTLIAALTHVELVEAVAAFDQVTVFAPTDQAFADAGLNAGNIATVFAGDEGKATLTDILLYHLKKGRQFSGSVLNKKQIRMINGGYTYPDADVPAIVDENGNAAIIAAPDVAASNGVIHIIRAVLLP